MIVDKGGHKVGSINHPYQNNEIDPISLLEKELWNKPEIAHIKNNESREGMCIELVQPMLISSEGTVQIKWDKDNEDPGNGMKG
jgi:hypothetical protein